MADESFTWADVEDHVRNALEALRAEFSRPATGVTHVVQSGDVAPYGNQPGSLAEQEAEKASPMEAESA